MKVKPLIAMLTVSFAACSPQATPPEPKVSVSSMDTAKTAQDVITLKVEAIVAKIDRDSRTLTLKGADGKLTSFRVGPEVTRFDEVKTGDTVSLDYVQSVIYELRAPTPEEMQSPRSAVELSARAPADVAPATGLARSIKSIVTVVGVDKVTQTVSVRNPEGEIVVVKAARPERLEKLNVGDTVAVTFTEAVAISLEPKSKRM